jgi:hypothetical protein
MVAAIGVEQGIPVEGVGRGIMYQSNRMVNRSTHGISIFEF